MSLKWAYFPTVKLLIRLILFIREKEEKIENTVKLTNNNSHAGEDKYSRMKSAIIPSWESTRTETIMAIMIIGTKLFLDSREDDIPSNQFPIFMNQILKWWSWI